MATYTQLGNANATRGLVRVEFTWPRAALAGKMSFADITHREEEDHQAQGAKVEGHQTVDGFVAAENDDGSAMTLVPSLEDVCRGSQSVVSFHPSLRGTRGGPTQLKV